MKIRTLFAALSIGAALGLSACATSSIQTAQMTAGKGLDAAQASVAFAAQQVHNAYVAGIVTKAQVQFAAKLVDKADDVSIAARTAYGKGDQATYQAMIAEIVSLGVQIAAIAQPPH